MPAPTGKGGGKKRDILLIYGHHASLERMFGLCEDLNQYGTVTMPDLPGFGGMESFYKLGEKPTLDNYADYLAAFIKLRYKRRRLTLIGTSFGFGVVTLMLQKYPELTKKIDLLVSLVGFVSKDDFLFKKRDTLMFKLLAGFLSLRPTSWLLRMTLLRKPVITGLYRLLAARNRKMKDANRQERDKRIAFEVYLWRANDIRTHMYTTRQMFRLNLCNAQVDLPVYHVSVKNDRYFDNHVVGQHMQVIYKKLHDVPTVMPVHAPSVVADASEAAPFVPAKLRRLLARKP